MNAEEAKMISDRFSENSHSMKQILEGIKSEALKGEYRFNITEFVDNVLFRKEITNSLYKLGYRIQIIKDQPDDISYYAYWGDSDYENS